MIDRKSLAGWTRVISRVVSSTAFMPEIVSALPSPNSFTPLMTVLYGFGDGNCLSNWRSTA